MKIKVDTKEKFKVWRPDEALFSVKMAEALTTNVIESFKEPSKSAIIDFSEVLTAERQALVELATLHQLCYKNRASLVLFNVNSQISQDMEQLKLTDVFNLTPSESEAWDIVQMEEIERELFDDPGEMEE
jgi:anti-anti-sigma regulatory factor